MVRSRYAVSVVVLLALAFGIAARAETTAKKPRGALPVVVMKQDKVQGNVYLIADDASPEKGAAELRVQVRALDSGKALIETKTGADGSFELEALEVGRYELVLGQLRMELVVSDPEALAEGEKQRTPKRILVFMPHVLADQS